MYIEYVIRKDKIFTPRWEDIPIADIPNKPQLYQTFENYKLSVKSFSNMKWQYCPTPKPDKDSIIVEVKSVGKCLIADDNRTLFLHCCLFCFVCLYFLN
jgi:hypothetical protein